ncbi:sensor histidine kinase [Curtobacterium albidum]|uniref:histidine kinase n=1 Tax=Curtobacterium citreum TaxID=2036 RepID=A0A850E2P2_9MICO|nr:sensor histidine kinase [Curtobacterium albidum]
MTTDAPAPTTGDRCRSSGSPRFARVGRVLPVAVVQVAGTLLASRISGGPPRGQRPPWAGTGVVVEPVDVVPLAVVLLVVGVLVLPWRWSFPRVVLAVTLATTAGYALLVTPRGPFVAALTMAMANAWFRGHRRSVLAAAVVAVGLLPAADLLTGRSPVYSLDAAVLALAWATVTIVVTELARVRLERAAERRRARAEVEQQRARDERVRIARELHDSVAHSMSLINLQAGVALHLGAALPSGTQESLTSIRDTSREALVELRTILGVLRSADGAGPDPDGRVVPERNPVPGLDRVPDLVDRARAAGVDVTARVEGDPTTVGGVVDRNAFRIVQESVTNVMKHAPGHRVDVTVSVGAEVLDLVVQDHPLPGAVQRPTRLGESGNGLIGMRERADAVGGTMTAGPTPDGGWRVAARLPVPTNRPPDRSEEPA